MNNANGILLTPRDGQTFRFDAGTLCLEFLLTGALPQWEQLRAPEDLAAWIPLSRLGLPDEVVVGEADLAGAKRLRAAIQALAEHAAAENHGGPGDPGTDPTPRGTAGTGESASPDPEPSGGASRGSAPDGGAFPGPEGVLAVTGEFAAAPQDALAVLNEFAAAPPPVPVVTPSFRRGWATPVTGAQFLSAVARDAVELFGGPMASRVRVCGGERCLLIFLDTSRPGARRWCSMDRCGNRYKLRTRRDRAPRPADAGH
ncbi:CGNR zinc finger domain-containing protein [Streptosporangium sandarakinum]|uniref:CGNR zinc finger domain-containing protein n=1 Tax=Streptosporangium sandarakinum TaxID=1260955 RepID=UPI0033B17E24